MAHSDGFSDAQIAAMLGYHDYHGHKRAITSDVIRTHIQENVAGYHLYSSSIKKNRKGGHKLTIYAYVGHPDQDEVQELPVIEIQTGYVNEDKTGVDIIDAKVFNKDIMDRLSDSQKMNRFKSMYQGFLRQFDAGEFPNILSELRANGLWSPNDNEGHIPIWNMLRNDEAFFPPEEEGFEYPSAVFVVPSFAIPAFVGIKTDADDKIPNKTREVVEYLPNGRAVGAHFDVQKDEKTGVFTLNIDGWLGDTSRNYNILSLTFEPVAPREGEITEFSRVKEAKIMGTNVNITDWKSVSRVVRSAWQAMDSLEKKKVPIGRDMIEDSMLFDVLNKSTPPAYWDDGGRLTYQVLGGNDHSEPSVIGPNMYLYTYDYRDEDGKLQKTQTLIDDGFRPLDRLEHGADGVIAKPDKDVPLRIIYTHQHMDHTAGTKYRAQEGQNVEEVVCNMDTWLVIEKELKDLGLKEDDPRWPNKITIVKPGDQIKVGPKDIAVKHSTVVKEPIDDGYDDVTQRKLDHTVRYRSVPGVRPTKNYPLVLRVGRAMHSVDAHMYLAKTKAGKILHTGDFKYHDTWYDWLSNQEDIVAVSGDFTNVDKPGMAPARQSVIEGNINLGQLPELKDKLTIRTFIAKNRPTFEDMLHVEGTLGRNIIVMGKSMKDLVTMINKTGIEGVDNFESLKKYYATRYGLTIVNMGSTKKPGVTVTKLLNGDLSKLSLWGTGSHLMDEMSFMQRLILGVNPHLWIDEKMAIIVNQSPAYNTPMYNKGLSLLRDFWGAQVYTPSDVKAKYDWDLYTSGHGYGDDIKKTLSGPLKDIPNVIITHTPAEKIPAAVEMIKSLGKNPIIPTNQDKLSIEQGSDKIFFSGYSKDVQQLVSNVGPRDRFYHHQVEHSLNQVRPLFSRKHIAPWLDATDHLKASRIQPHSVESLVDRYENIVAALPDAVNDNTASEMDKDQIYDYVMAPLNDRYVTRIITCDTETSGRQPSAYVKSYGGVVYDKDYKEKLDEFDIKLAVPPYIVQNPVAQIKAPVTYDGSEFDERKGIDKIRHTIWGHVKDDSRQTRKKPKTALVMHNGFKFDFPKLERRFYEEGYKDQYLRSRGRVVLIDTLNIARAISVFGTGKFKIGMRDINGEQWQDFTLSGLAVANGIDIDNIQLHDAKDDSILLDMVFKKMIELEPEITRAMIENEHHSTIVDRFIPQGVGGGTKRQVIGYAKRDRKQFRPRAGALIKLDNEEKFGKAAIILNLAYDPRDMVEMSEDDLADLMSQRGQDIFEVVRTNKMPTVVPDTMLYDSTDKFRGMPREYLEDNAKWLDENPDFQNRILNAYYKARQKGFDRTTSFIEQTVHHIPKKQRDRIREQPQAELLDRLYTPKPSEFKASDDPEAAENLKKRRIESLSEFQDARYLNRALNIVAKLYGVENIPEHNREEYLAKRNYLVNGNLGEDFDNVANAMLEIAKIKANIEEWRLEYPNIDELIEKLEAELEWQRQEYELTDEQLEKMKPYIRSTVAQKAGRYAL